MRHIRIEYRRFWRDIQRSIDMPENWQEISPAQFTAVVNLWLGEISISEFLVNFLGIKRREASRLSDYQQWVIMHELDWIQDLRQPHNAFFIETLPGTKLAAPGDRLRGCSLQQFMTADTYFSLYLSSKDISHLDMMIAALYKEELEVYSTEEQVEPAMRDKVKLLSLDEHLPVISQQPESVKTAIFLNFTLIKSWLAHAFPFVFPEAEEEEEDIKRKKRLKKSVTVDWLSVFDSFVGDDIAQMEKYKAMDATDAFRIMNRRIREAKKRAAQRHR